MVLTDKIGQDGSDGYTPQKGVDYFTEDDIAEIRSGLQEEITSSNKLESDLIDDTNQTNKFVTENEKSIWDNKSDFSGSYDDLTDKPTIPGEVTETTVSNWGFTKNTGTYIKPNDGIPKTDLESAVQTSLGKADTALQEHQDISGKLDTSKVKNSTSTTSGDVYDVTYINTIIGNIETLLSEV